MASESWVRLIVTVTPGSPLASRTALHPRWDWTASLGMEALWVSAQVGEASRLVPAPGEWNRLW